MNKTLILLCAISLTAYGFDETDTITGEQTNIDTDMPADQDLEYVEPEYFDEEEEESDGGGVDMHRRSSSSRSTKVSANLGVSMHAFSAQIGLWHYFYQYFRGELLGYYSSRKQDDIDHLAYGPEVYGVIPIVNRSMFVPFAGAGVGYETWKQEYLDKNEIYESSSATGTYLFGLDVNLTKNFTIRLLRRFKNYLSDQPLEDDGETKLAEQQISSEISFQVVF